MRLPLPLRLSASRAGPVGARGPGRGRVHPGGARLAGRRRRPRGADDHERHARTGRLRAGAADADGAAPVGLAPGPDRPHGRHRGDGRPRRAGAGLLPPGVAGPDDLAGRRGCLKQN